MHLVALSFSPLFVALMLCASAIVITEIVDYN